MNSYKTDTRPFSDNLVDLHISVVPMDHWVEKLNYASHKVIGDTFSVGFIRVLPDTTVAMLRHEINDQLGSDMFPSDYVFLKHVGRCLALVRQSQEKHLKVKNFLPPHSIMPEIFILPGQPAMYTYKVLPPIQPRIQDLHLSMSDETSDAANFKINGKFAHGSLQTKSQFKYYDNEFLPKSPRYSPNIENQPVTGHLFDESRKANHPQRRTRIGASPTKSRIPSSIQRRELKRQQRHVSGKSNYDNEPNLNRSTAHNQPSEFQSENKDENYHPSAYLPQSPPDSRRPSLVKSMVREGPRKRRVRYNMPPQSNASSQENDFNSTSDLSPHAKHAADSRHYNQRSSASNSSYRSIDRTGFNMPPPGPRFLNIDSNPPVNGRVRRQFIDTSSHVFANPANPDYEAAYTTVNYETNPSRNSEKPHLFSNRPVAHDDPQRFVTNSNYAPESRNADEYVSPAPEDDHALEPEVDSTWQVGNNPTNVKSNSANNDSGYVEHELSDSDDYFFKSKEARHSVDGDGQHKPSQEQSGRMENDDSLAENEALDRVKDNLEPFSDRPISSSVLASDHQNSDVVPRKTVVDPPTSQASSNLPASTEARNDVEETTTDKDPVQTSRVLENSEKARLWEELLQVRAQRQKAEKTRQELVQQAKVVTSKMNQKRNSVRDLWKKKFFEEKKKTLPLEDTCRRLQGELDSSHRRLVTAMENSKPIQHKKLPPLIPPATVFTPSMKNNNKIQAARLQHDMDILRRRIEDAKIKLTGEIKLRHQAEQHVKTVRQELLAKKIRAHIAYRELNRTHRNPINA